MTTPDGPFRSGSLQVLAAKCETCIFRPDNLMHLKDGRRDDMVRECLQQNTVIVCHETLDGPRSVCRGFYDVHRGDVMPIRLAIALDMLGFDNP